MAGTDTSNSSTHTPIPVQTLPAAPTAPTTAGGTPVLNITQLLSGINPKSTTGGALKSHCLGWHKAGSNN